MGTVILDNNINDNITQVNTDMRITQQAISLKPYK